MYRQLPSFSWPVGKVPREEEILKIPSPSLSLSSYLSPPTIPSGVAPTHLSRKREWKQGSERVSESAPLFLLDLHTVHSQSHHMRDECVKALRVEVRHCE